MSLCSRDEIKLELGVTNAASDGLFDLLLGVASDAIADFCGYPLESAQLVEFYSGNGMPDLPLKRRPVAQVVSVRHDPLGAWGQAAGSFDSTTELAAGVDWALVLEGDPNKGRSGLLRRLAGGSAMLGYLGPWGFGLGYTRGHLTPVGGRVASWPYGDGNLRVEYLAGWNPVPSALKQACINLVAWLRRNAKSGGLATTAETLGKYSYTLSEVQATKDAARQGLAGAGDLGSTRQLLARYRELATG